MAEITSLPTDSTITGTELLTVVDVSDSNLGKTFTVDAFEAYLQTNLSFPTPLTNTTILGILNASTGAIDGDLLTNAPNDNTQLTSSTILGVLNGASGSIDADLLTLAAGTEGGGSSIIVQPADSSTIVLEEGNFVIGTLTGFFGNIYRIGANPPSLTSTSNFANAAFVLVSGGGLTTATILAVLNGATGNIDADLLSLAGGGNGGTSEYLVQPTDSSTLAYTANQVILATNAAILGNLYRTIGAGSIASGSMLGGSNFVLINDGLALDDEEGTWGPTPDNADFSAFLNITAEYTKIGNLVRCWAEFDIPATSTSLSDIQINGIPFTESDRGSIGGTGSTGIVPFVLARNTNTGDIIVLQANSLGAVGSARYEDQAGSTIRVEFTYQTDS